MAIPNSRETFKEHCLRRLGKGVIDINVSDEQVDDRIDQAIIYYQDYHFDGVQKTFLKHTVTQTDKDNGYITVSDNNIIGVIDIFDIGDATSTNNLFNIRSVSYTHLRAHET